MSDEQDAPGWSELLPEDDDAAANLLAECAVLGSAAAAREAISAVRAAPAGGVYGWRQDGQLIAVYGLRKQGMSFAVPWLAVDATRRGERYGKSALVDALRRSGRMPMTVEADDALVGWFQRTGFKIVGRRPLPGGGFRYRLGWYAPRRPNEPGYGAHG